VCERRSCLVQHVYEGRVCEHQQRMPHTHHPRRFAEHLHMSAYVSIRQHAHQGIRSACRTPTTPRRFAEHLHIRVSIRTFVLVKQVNCAFGTSKASKLGFAGGEAPAPHLRVANTGSSRQPATRYTPHIPIYSNLSRCSGIQRYM